MQVSAKRAALISRASKVSRDLGVMASGLLRTDVDTRTSARALKAALLAPGVLLMISDDPPLRHHQMSSVQKSPASRPFELETESALPILSAHESGSQHSGPASAPQSQAPQKSAEAPRGAKSQSTSSISRTCKICKVLIFAPSSRIHVNGSHSALICYWLTRVGICAIIFVVCRICFVAQPGL